MTSDALIAMIERKLKAYGLKKVVPDEDLLAETYRAFHRSEQLREKFEEMEAEFDDEAEDVAVPKRPDGQRFARSSTSTPTCDGTTRSGSCSTKRRLDRVRAEKEKAKKKAGDFTDEDDGWP